MAAPSSNLDDSTSDSGINHWSYDEIKNIFVSRDGRTSTTRPPGLFGPVSTPPIGLPNWSDNSTSTISQPFVDPLLSPTSAPNHSSNERTSSRTFWSHLERLLSRTSDRTDSGKPAANLVEGESRKKMKPAASDDRGYRREELRTLRRQMKEAAYKEERAKEKNPAKKREREKNRRNHVNGLFYRLSGLLGMAPDTKDKTEILASAKMFLDEGRDKDDNTNNDPTDHE
jgi:hypothetical protein